MSRPDRVALWHVHSVLDSSLIRGGDRNVFVDADVAELVHYRRSAGDDTTTAVSSTRMKRFTSRIVEQLQIGVDICLSRP